LQQKIELKISTVYAGERLDAALANLLTDYSRSRIQKWIKEGLVLVNNTVCTKPREMIMGDEMITVQVEIHNETEIPAQDIDIEVVYEDEDILVINKPAGLVVHPGAGNPDQTLMNALLFHYPEIREVPRAGIVHRLDKETSGLMVVAKTVRAQTHLVDQLQRHEVARIYDAVTVGIVKRGGTIDKAIGRSPKDRKKMAVRAMGGKPAVTHYRVLEHFRAHSRIRVKLETGRTHQIRVHMADLGYPLVGDPVYGAKFRIPGGMYQEFVDYLRGFTRQALHAGALALTHPVSGKQMKFKAPLPGDFETLLDVLRDDIAGFDESDCEFEEYDYDDGVIVEYVTDDQIPS